MPCEDNSKRHVRHSIGSQTSRAWREGRREKMKPAVICHLLPGTDYRRDLGFVGGRGKQKNFTQLKNMKQSLSRPTNWRKCNCNKHGRWENNQDTFFKTLHMINGWNTLIDDSPKKKYKGQLMKTYSISSINLKNYKLKSLVLSYYIN